VAFILDFLDALIRVGYTGKDNAIVQARQAGVDWLRDVLLPDWTGGDTWGRNYWDWPCGVQVENVTEFAARYLMEHPDEFPNWRNDTRNIMTLFLNRTSVSPHSNGDVYSGAWAYPESSGCCGRSLWYGPTELANTYAQYGVLAGSEWGRELARRTIILATYDCHETGVVEDNIDGGAIVAGDWFKIAHPMALKHVLATMAWLPEVLGASRENHIMRSSGVVSDVVYGDGRICYRTHPAPPSTVEVLRLAFRPASITVDDKILSLTTDGQTNGYQLKELPDGDCIVTVRHESGKTVVIEGEDPQQVADDKNLTLTGNWSSKARDAGAGGSQGSGTLHTASDADAAMTCTFTGNQVRVIGDVGPDAGLADVYLDGQKQLVGVDCWNPTGRDDQVLYYRNGLPNASHTLKVVVKGAKNPLAKGTSIHIARVQYSAATAKSGRAAFGEGGGPTDAQRFVFGYAGRADYVDSTGNAWRPGTEFVIRAGNIVDSVAASWWTRRTQLQIDGTDDPELYRYGIHGREFWVDFTVGPGTYHARLNFAETRHIEPKLRAVTVLINGHEMVSGLDIAATAGEGGKASQVAHPSGRPHSMPVGMRRAVDLVFNNIQPANGIISIRFKGSYGGEAIVQAIEVGPGDGGAGAQPITVPPPPPQSATAPG